MSQFELENDALEKIRGLETYFRNHLPNFEIGVSGLAHYKNGQTDDLLGGREFQFYRPASASLERKHAMHRVRFARTFLDDNHKSILMERLRQWKLIDLLNRNGESALLVSGEGIVEGHL